MPATPSIEYGVVNVGLADAKVLDGNPDRLHLLVSNPGPNPVWVAFGVAAVVNGSILIPVGGAPVLFDGGDFPGLLALDLHAITTGAAGKLAGLSQLLQRYS